MKLSIIIPSYMGEKYIPSVVAALEAQSDKEFEVIFIVDGARNETSLEFLQELKTRYKDTLHILFNSKRQKRLSSIFEGINIAIGDYISICSTKDIMSPDYVKTINNIIDKHNPDVIEHKFKYHKSKITPNLLVKTNKLINLEKDFSPIAKSIPFDFNKIIRRDIAQNAQKVVYVDGGSRFDFSFCFNVMCMSKTYYAINKVLKSTIVLHSSLINPRSTMRAIKNNWTICKFSDSEELMQAFIFQAWSALCIYQMQVLLVAKKTNISTHLYNGLVKIREKKEYKHMDIHNKYFTRNLLSTKLFRSFPNIKLYKKIVRRGGM